MMTPAVRPRVTKPAEQVKNKKEGDAKSSPDAVTTYYLPESITDSSYLHYVQIAIWICAVEIELVVSGLSTLASIFGIAIVVLLLISRGIENTLIKYQRQTLNLLQEDKHLTGEYKLEPTDLVMVLKLPNVTKFGSGIVLLIRLYVQNATVVGAFSSPVNLLSFGLLLVYSLIDEFMRRRNNTFKLAYNQEIQLSISRLLKNLRNVSIRQGVVMSTYVELAFSCKGQDADCSYGKVAFSKKLFHSLLTQTCLKWGVSVLRDAETFAMLYQQSDESCKGGISDFFNDFQQELMLEEQIFCASRLLDKLLRYNKNSPFREVEFEVVKNEGHTATFIGSIHGLDDCQNHALVGALKELAGDLQVKVSQEEKGHQIVILGNANDLRGWHLRLVASQNTLKLLTQPRGASSSSGVSRLSDFSSSSASKPGDLKKEGRSVVRTFTSPKLPPLGQRKKPTLFCFNRFSQLSIVELTPVLWSDGTRYVPNDSDALVQYWKDNVYVEWNVSDREMDTRLYHYYKNLLLKDQTRNIQYVGNVCIDQRYIGIYKLINAGEDDRVWGCVVSVPGESILIRFFKVAGHDETNGPKKEAGFKLRLVREALRDRESRIVASQGAHCLRL